MAVILLDGLPLVPRTERGWILLLLLGPPVLLALEWAGGVLWDDETGAMCGARFSFARLAAALAVLLSACGALAWFFLFA